MTRRTIDTVRRQIVALRAEGLTWAKIAQRVHILKADGSPDTGMTYTIGVYGREPIDPQARERIGLPAICQQCKRPMPRSDFKHSHRHAQRSALRHHQHWWYRELTADQRDEEILHLYEKKEGMR